MKIPSSKSIKVKKVMSPEPGNPNMLTDDASDKNDNQIPWSNGAYKIWWNVRRFFQNPFSEQKKELRLLDQVELLLVDGDATAVAETCEKYITLHRIVENTKARRRLEKWVTRLIVLYLLVVFLLVLAGAFEKYLYENKLPFVSMNEKIVIALLTTTTINIVALGIILVRGLFHEEEDKDVKKEKPITKE